jgi:hypothetical protein
MSLYTMAFMGVAPLGGLLAGALAGVVGTPATLRLGAALCALGSVSFALRLARLRGMVRPVYVRLGILQDAGSGAYPVVLPPPPTAETVVAKAAEAPVDRPA